MEPAHLGCRCLGLPYRLVRGLSTFPFPLPPSFARRTSPDPFGADTSGSVLSRYNLFATNVIVASISFVYFPNSKWPATVINVFTLLGSVIGQFLFGYLADRYGRKSLYGIELVLVIVSTIGVATSNTGYGDMSFLALFTFVSLGLRVWDVGCVCVRIC